MGLFLRMRRKPPHPELETEDKALAERMLAGDEEAFEDFFDGHLVSATVLELDRGAVYLDSGPEGGAAARFESGCGRAS